MSFSYGLCLNSRCWCFTSSTAVVLWTVQFWLLLSHTVQYSIWFSRMRSNASRCAISTASPTVSTFIPPDTLVEHARTNSPFTFTMQVSQLSMGHPPLSYKHTQHHYSPP